MEEAEIEILEPSEVDCVPAQAEVRVMRVPVQTVIINGERRAQYGEAPAIVCPKCGGIIRQFGVGTPLLEVLKSLNTGDEEELRAICHCARCGKPLRIMRPLPIDADGSVR